MKIKKTFYFVIIFGLSYFCSISIFGQDDISVNFTFIKPNEFVCEIQNLTDYEMIMWFEKSTSDIYIEMINTEDKSIRYNFFAIPLNPDLHFLKFKAKEVYRVKYFESDRHIYMTASVTIKYAYKGTETKGGIYSKLFDLYEIRKKYYGEIIY